MKKFKNNLSIRGNKHLLEAFAAELRDLGYTPNNISGKFDWISNTKNIITNPTTYGFHNHDEGIDFILALPEDWNKALALAAEEEIASKFQVGDFISADHDLGYVKAIENNKYTIIWETGGPIEVESYSIEDFGDQYKKISDQDALEQLKQHYAKQGIVEGAKVQYGNSHKQIIRNFGLLKNANANYRNFSDESGYKQGNSRLAIYIGCNGFWVTATTTDFKIASKEVKIAGYACTISRAHGTEKLIKIGCKWFTEDALIALRDLIIHGHNGAHTFAHFNLSKVGAVKVTVDELNQAIKLLES